MPKHLLFLFACILLSLTACGDQLAIKFGDGGGFAGAVNSYSIDAERNINKVNVLNNSKEAVGTISKQQAKAALKLIKSANLLELDYNKPRNVYKFLELTKGDKTNYIAWPSTEKSEEVAIFNELHQILTQSIVSNE